VRLKERGRREVLFFVILGGLREEANLSALGGTLECASPSITNLHGCCASLLGKQQGSDRCVVIRNPFLKVIFRESPHPKILLESGGAKDTSVKDPPQANPLGHKKKAEKCV